MVDDSLAPLGLSAEAATFYRLLLSHGSTSLTTLSDLASSDLARVDAAVGELVRLGLTRRARDGQVVLEPPEQALGRLVQQQTARLVDAQAALGRARLSVPDLLAQQRDGSASATGSADVQRLEPDEFLDVMCRLLVETTGEVVYLRPDQWALPSSLVTNLALLQELRTGRESRALYPADALSEPNADVRQRIDAGERVRVMPQVPTRLAVLGTEAAVLPEWWGSPKGQRLVVRQPALVRALRELFDLLWERAQVPPGSSEAAESDGPRQLAALLARGLVDDQIARTLGCSVRTVRRRVSDLMAELGASSRFEAGALAAHRGWLSPASLRRHEPQYAGPQPP